MMEMLPKGGRSVKHRAIEAVGPVVEIAAGTVVEPCDGASLDHAPAIEEPGLSMATRKRRRYFRVASGGVISIPLMMSLAHADS